MHTYILLDRTGSMAHMWDEALSSVNAYARRFGEMGPSDTTQLDTKVTFAVFDHHSGLKFDVLRSGVKAANWVNVTSEEAYPRGGTPLFDAIGRLISIAERDAPEKAVIVIMTDGLENASAELTREGARQALKRCQDRGWETVFLGAEFANFSDAMGLGVRAAKSMAVASGNLDESMEVLASKSRDYGYGRKKNVFFDHRDRKVAAERRVKDRSK